AAGDGGRQLALAGLERVLAVHAAQQLVVLGLQALQSGHVLSGEPDDVGGQVGAGNPATPVALDAYAGEGPPRASWRLPPWRGRVAPSPRRGVGIGTPRASHSKLDGPPPGSIRFAIRFC